MKRNFMNLSHFRKGKGLHESEISHTANNLVYNLHRELLQENQHSSPKQKKDIAAKHFFWTKL